MELVGSANNQSYNSFTVHALNFEMVEDLDYFVTHSKAVDLPNDDFNESICPPEQSWHPVCDVNKVVADVSCLLSEVRCMHKCHCSGASLKKGAFGAPEICRVEKMKLLNHNRLCCAP